jgi:Ras-related protein Rab-18
MPTTTSDTSINCKLIIIGNASVGKSSLLLRFADHQWLPEDESSATIGVDFRVSKLDVGGKSVKLSIWDTAGQERFRNLTSSYYRGAQGIILVYDVSNRESFEALPRWFTELESFVSEHVVKIVVANKVDKETSRQVTTSEGRSFANKMGTHYVEASAKTDVGVQEAFREVVEKIIDTPELWSSPGKPNTKSPRNNGKMPGGVSLNAPVSDSSAADSGCSC